MTPRLVLSQARSIVGIGLLFVVIGCAPKAAEETTTVTSTPAATASADVAPSVDRTREVAAISLEIEREPGRTTAILEAHGMTADEFENELVAIAADAALSEAYEAARQL